MARAGRKPLATRHVDHLEGSEHARQRMKLLLACMMGETTVPEACRELGICESRFHALRNQWLQESLELLEPRRTGRPPGRQAAEARDELAAKRAELEQENERLKQEVRELRVQLEVARMETPQRPVPAKRGAAKKSGDKLPERCFARRSAGSGTGN